MTTPWPIAAAAALILATPPLAHAQLSAQAADERQAPDAPDDGFVAKARRLADDWQLAARLSGDIDGWYPRLGRMTRGSGVAFGPGYRFHAFDERVLFDVSAGVSLKGYKAADANIRWLQAFGDRVELWTDFHYEDFPQEDFFGTGMGSRLDDRTSYDLDGSDTTVRGVVMPLPWLRFEAGLGYARPDIGPGTDDKYPSIEERFTDADAPGLLEQPNFFHTTFSGEINYLDRPGNPASGGFYRGSFGTWNDTTLHQYDHRRFDALAVQYVPLAADRRHVLSGRLGLSYVNNETGEQVPFYALAYVGGVDTIRSLREFRFKDENAMWLGAEYKWTFHERVSLVTFLDAGEVNADWNDIDLRGLKTGYGFGFRVHTDKYTLARIDVGTGGGEGWQVFLKVGPSF